MLLSGEDNFMQYIHSAEDTERVSDCDSNVTLRQRKKTHDEK